MHRRRSQGRTGRRETVKKKMHAVKSMERRFEKENENMTEMPEQEGAIFFKLGNKERQFRQEKQ